jgi:hypothetical protein
LLLPGDPCSFEQAGDRKLAFRARNKHHFASLDPTRIRHTDFVDFSHTVRPHIAYHPSSLLRGAGMCRYLYLFPLFDTYFASSDLKTISGRVHYLDDGRKHGVLPFPHNARGFLYCAGPENHPAGCEIRLSLASSPEPEHLRTGKDLLLPDGRVWSVPVPRTHAGLYSPFREWLLDTLRVTPDMLKSWSDTPVTRKSQFIHSLGQPFVVIFSKRTQVKLWVARGSELRRVLLDLRKLWHAPYKDDRMAFAGEMQQSRLCFPL